MLFRSDHVWNHGDFVSINHRGGVKILGRSDATLNPSGVRIGTAELYRVVETIESVMDSLVIGRKIKDDEEIVLFVKLLENRFLDEALIKTIKQTIKQVCSPRHVPKDIYQISDIPYTLNGKKIEILIKKIFSNPDIIPKSTTLANPECLRA